MKPWPIAAGCAVLSFAGCSSGSPTTTTTSPLTTCDVTTRQGTYLFQYKTVSGNCGTIPDTLQNIAVDQMMSAQNGCSVLMSQFSDGNCVLTGVIACPATGGTQTITEVSVEQKADGSVITGEVTFTSAMCTGTYDFTATRQ